MEKNLHKVSLQLLELVSKSFLSTKEENPFFFFLVLTRIEHLHFMYQTNHIYLLFENNTDYKRKIIQLDDNKYYKLTIWDTAGQERFRTITQAYFRGSHGMLLVFDVGSEKTFKSIEHWMKQIDDHTTTTGRDSLPPKVVLVGNKCDLPDSQRQVTKERAEAMAKKWGVPYIETSAKEKINVQDAFMTVTRLVAPELSPNENRSTTISDVGSEPKKNCAC